MTTFVIVAAVLLVVVVAALLVPLLRTQTAAERLERDEANLQILRDQLRELDRDLADGVLSSEQFENAREDLERRVLEETGKSGAVSTAAGNNWLTPAIVALLVPAASVLFYQQLGSREGLDVDAYMQAQTDRVTPERVLEMTHQLVQHLENNPDDVEGWVMLGRAYEVLHQFDSSAQALGRAAKLAPTDSTILVEYAEALVLVADGDFSGEPTRLLGLALKLDPEHNKALAMSGGAAFRRGDYKAAIENWTKLQSINGVDDELTQALRSGIAEARARMQGGAAKQAVAGTALAGTVSLSPDLSSDAAPEDVVFVFARAAGGPGVPLAVVRATVRDLPYAFRLDDSMSVMSGRKLSEAQNVVVSARISKSGNATPASGDLQGFSAVVPSGASNVQVTIDQRVP